MNIAIDGPAGAGKSTIAKNLAARLGFVYLDTGAMYRAVALKALETGTALNDESALGQMLASTDVSVVYDNGKQRILLDGRDVSDEIRSQPIAKAASDVSANKCVRLKMVEMQRAIAAKADTILDGRDIGTFVLPDARFKFYLTASIAERAKRRHKELAAKGVACELADIEREIEQRDFNDMNREFAPLSKAVDAEEIDTTGMTIEQVTEEMLRRVQKA